MLRKNSDRTVVTHILVMPNARPRKNEENDSRQGLKIEVEDDVFDEGQD